jgi:hypothetical protein
MNSNQVKYDVICFALSSGQIQEAEAVS